jgi:hypothetical protein
MIIDPEGLLMPPTDLAGWFLVGDPEKGKLKADMIGIYVRRASSSSDWSARG